MNTEPKDKITPKQLTQRLLELWPEAALTEQEIELFMARISPMDPAAVMKAMEVHRMTARAFNSHRPDFGAIIAEVPVSKRGKSAASIAVENPAIAVRRLAHECKADAIANETDDVKAIVAWHTHVWNATPTDASAASRAMIRALVYSACLTQLQHEIIAKQGGDYDGWQRKAVQLAREVVGLRDGERIGVAENLRGFVVGGDKRGTAEFQQAAPPSTPAAELAKLRAAEVGAA